MNGFYCLVIALALSATSTAQQLQRGWAWSGMAYATLGSKDSRPTPLPPKPDNGICSTCLGTGKVGDGRVWQICRDCNGTGKTGQAPPAAPAPSPSDRVVQPATVVSRIEPAPVLQDCPGGVCPTPTKTTSTYSKPIAPPTTTTRRGWIFRR